MAREVLVSELVGTVEIAERAGVSGPKVVHDWRHRHKDFPSPVAKVGATSVWRWRDVHAWLRKTGRMK